MEKRFRALRIIATILKIIAWIVLVVGVLAAIFVFISGVAAGGLANSSYLGNSPAFALGTLFTGVLGGFVVLLAVLFYFLVLYAMSEAIYLGLAIEENTRETAHYLKGGDNLPRQV
jgi:hypothetical protein